ncbi:MAG: glutamate 5-kinase, partial [Defluviitaleaceae bacterium]|nr:glutamate 5-kinase [Defluviitaleaceae bacterium]
VVPVVNANDTIATDELEEVSDNDRLSAHVAVLAGADLLIILSDIEGLYSADPKVVPDAKFFHEIYEITPELEAMAGGAGSNLGTGGMATKIMAARIALKGEIDTVIALGEEPGVLWQLLNGEQVGTLFVAKGR